MRNANRLARWACACGLALTLGCVATGPSGGGGGGSPQQSSGLPKASAASPAQAERLKRTLLPVLAVMNHPLAANEVSVGILDDPSINAANAGSGRFFVTKGLLDRANDGQLMAIMAHEAAHEDLNHVARAQVRAAGVGIGIAILDQVFPGSGVVTPIAGQLVLSKYSREEEFAADAHGAELLQRAGVRRELMADTLSWLMQQSGGSEGGFFSTHPGTTDRIAALRNSR
jgi:Zn-dependent protease with chaperone function